MMPSSIPVLAAARAGFQQRFLMAESSPRLRSDLEIRSESASPDAAVVLKDPITSRFYRFAPMQAAVLHLLDGTHASGAIAAEIADRFKTEVLESQIEDFVVKVRELLLIDHPAVWAKLDQKARSKSRFWGALLSIKLHAFNPDKALTQLERRFRFCFRPWFIFLTGTAIVAASIISILNWESMYVSLETLFSIYSLPLLIMVAFCIMTIHEFAHGLTLKHYGGTVEEMGLLVLYFIPAFYCNVSDAWMLGKRERIHVTLSGAFAQLGLWAGATICWRMLAPETIASQICLVAIAFAGIQTIFNLNPLIRLDGYYLLSDWLEIPNLRSKAFRYLRARLTNWVLATHTALGIGSSKRERRIFATYGTVSALFSLGLLGLLLQRFAGWLVDQFQGWGILLLSSLFVLALAGCAKESKVTSRNFFKAAAGRLKRARFAMLILVLIVATFFLPWELKISGDFTILPSKKITVGPEVDGTLKMIFVDEGSHTRAGEVLAIVENLDLNNSYEETRGELQSQSAGLDLLRAGSRPEEIERARRLVETKNAELSSSVRVEEERKMLRDTIAKKQAELQNAQLNHERAAKLLKDGLVAKNEADRERTTYEVQQKELLEAEGQLKVLEERTENVRQLKKKELEQTESELKILLAGSRKEAVQVTEAQVAKLEEKLKILSHQLEYLKILSPIDGVVTTPHLKEHLGEYLNKGDRFCDIVSEGTVLVEMPVPEKEIADVHFGLPITLKVRGYPKADFSAKIKGIAPIAVEGARERTVMVQGELTNADGALKSGMTGVGKILCGKRMVADLITRRAIRWLRTEFWEYLP
jgi:putative peptide zinc metalloprotease protein